DDIYSEVIKFCGKDTLVNWYIFADFLVCPLEKDTPGTMRTICVKSVKNIRVECPKKNKQD
ncbi:MAG: hypothetical protein PVG39_27020, partial [Desulfobacteraceae bacterium]